MRVFLISCLAVVVLAVGAFLSLSAVQTPSGVRYSTEGARIDPSWSFRHDLTNNAIAPKTMAMAEKASDERCDRSSAWASVRADFGNTPTAEPVCKH